MKELKATIFKSRFHVTRFLGLLIMPFLYAFTFTLAFFDPFGHTQNIPMKVVTNKVGAKPILKTTGTPQEISDAKAAFVIANEDYANQKFIDELGREMTNPGTEIVTGGMTLSLNMEHIYVDGSGGDDKVNARLQKIAEDGYTTFYIPKLTHTTPSITTSIVSKLIKMMATAIPSTGTKNIVLINEMVKIIKEYNLGTTQTWANYKQSYLLGFSSDVSGAMSGKHNLVLSKMTDVLLRLNQGVIDEFGTPVVDHKYDWFKTMIKANIAPSSTDAAIKTTATAAVTLFKDLKDSGIFTLHPVKVTSQMGTLGKNNHPTYGYGLGVFFIAVGMWIGAIVMTFAVHSKVHDKTVHPTKRYLIKFSIIALGIFIQSTILMTTLWFIGYSEIGIGHWFTLYMGVTVSSIVFAAIVQAIRFTIPNRVFGIFMVIILLVLQIAASGGLFPYETQAGFYRGLHHILPMTYAINISREALFDTNWNNIFMNFGYLFIFLFTIPLGIVIKNRQDAAYYKKMDWQLPEVKGGKNV